MSMPTVPPAPKPPGKLKKLFSWIGGIPKRIWGWSLAGRAALVTALVLTVLVIVAWTIFFMDPESVPWRHSMTFGRIVAVLSLLVVIPILVHRTLRLWLEGEASQFPDIDFAWKTGLAALARNGIDVTATPIFLILGCADERQQRAMMEASGRGLRVRETPAGPAALHWYAGPDCVFLFCSQASWLSALTHQVNRREASDGTGSFANPEIPTPTSTPTPASMMPEQQLLVGEEEDAGRGTIMLNQYMGRGAPLPAPIPAPESSSDTGVRGTMMMQAPVQFERPIAAAPSMALDTAGARRSTVLPPQDAAEQSQRLQYTCQLLRRIRQPLCAVNGILTVFDFEALQGTAREAEELERAIRSDLGMVSRGLGLRAPTTALVAGLEKEPGFRELVRRVGRERASAQRFGQRFDLRSLATPAEIAALTVHVSGAFEDWVHMLFKERGALSRPGNTSLYGLLCKVRSNLKTRLAEILAGGFGYDPERDTQSEPVLFSGCYFAATGDSEDRQAFVQGVFDKLVEEQEDVEWTQKALVYDRRYRIAGYLGRALDVMLVASIIGLIVWKVFWK